MKTTLFHTAEYTWETHEEFDNLYCGSVLFCRLEKGESVGGMKFYRMHSSAFLDAVASCGWGSWYGQPFDLRAIDLEDAHRLVEKIYDNVFDRMKFKGSLR